MNTRFLSIVLPLAIGSFANAQNSLSEQEVNLRFDNNLSVGTRLGVSGTLLSNRSARYDLNLGYSRAAWGLRGSVRRTGEEFAPNDTWFGVTQLLPRNSQDVSLSGYLSVSPQVRLLGGATKGESLPGNSFDFTNWSTQLEYRFSPNAYGILGFDNLDIEMYGGSLLRRQWATLGFGMEMGQGSMFKLLLQYGEVGSNTSSSNTNRGHVISGQISVKF